MELDCFTYFNSGAGGGVIAVEPSRGNGNVSPPVHVQLPLCLFFVEQNKRLLDSLCAS